MRYLDLPEPTRLSLLRGFVERSWHAPGLTAEESAMIHARISEPQAYEDGLRLRAVVDAINSAVDFDALNAAERAYDDVATELNQRYGDGVVALSTGAEELGIRGFRGQGFETRSSVLVGEELVAS
ncbi:hypothetical protein [Nocardioides jishulii]|uniref:Uncharacterized protein n=1 Tax=Nocardioides jishulii TaxID=2575440 RepID=A0A4V6X632_9ACTN|nr:hypothetical protein [Nocardioides jishulii]QCX26560.1 hypothetical protein FCL41_02635 [Nocardioides jishulii]TKI63633.1 hypothetical protein FC770_00070 [Nocardioides jishulii]